MHSRKCTFNIQIEHNSTLCPDTGITYRVESLEEYFNRCKLCGREINYALTFQVKMIR